MARLYAQLFSLVFLVVGFAGLLAGDAGHPESGSAGGNLAGLTLHLTWTRDALDIAVALILAWVGFVAARHAGRLTVIGIGLFFVALAVAGFLIGDDDQAGKGLATLHFPLAVNVFDAIVGALAVLCGLGTVEDPEPPQVSTLTGRPLR